jgi:hypothetical protein
MTQNDYNIFEGREEWTTTFRSGWEAYTNANGHPEWDLYHRVRNKNCPTGTPIDLKTTRLMLISTAGGYLKDSQQPFDAASLYGDYTLREFPLSTPLDALDFAHDHYDHANIDADRQVALPLRHLEDMAREGLIGEVVPTVVSFSGYQPDATRIVDELYPAILEIAQRERVESALLIPL